VIKRSRTSPRSSRKASSSLPPDFPREVEALACDLDRTLIAEDGILRPRTRCALRAARDAGLHVVVATGRMFRSVRPYAEQAGLVDPIVCYQGAVVADPSTGEFLLHEPIPLETALQAIAAVVAEGFHINCYVNDELYVAEETPEARRYADFQHLQIHEVGPLRDWLDRPPTKLVVVGDPRQLDQLEQRLKQRFAGRLYISKSLPYFLELASPNVTKASGLRFAAEHIGFSLERTVAFGDGENDVELLESAGYALAVANAHDRVLAVADHVCPPADEEGVAQVIEAYLELFVHSRP
jgi:Cof subfamily protein (haloacid dehalogenase superfamily)